MNDLQKAYSILGLDPGSSIDAITSRYKALVLVWHPDRFPAARKAEAEQELKRINLARDVLRDHFTNGGHRQSGYCECQTTDFQQPGQSRHTTGGPGHSADQSGSTTGAQAQAEATRKGDENSRRRTEKEADRKAQQEASPTGGQTVNNAFRTDGKQNHEALRWKIALGCGAMFVLLISVLVVSDCFAGPIPLEPKAVFESDQNDTDRAAAMNQSRTPFISNEQSAGTQSDLVYRLPPIVATQEQQRQSDQALSTAKLAVERYQQAIEFSQKRLAELEIQLADPTISIRDRQFAISEQGTQLRFFQESQMNLKYAQQFLDELQVDRTGMVATHVVNSPAPTNEK